MRLVFLEDSLKIIMPSTIKTQMNIVLLAVFGPIVLKISGSKYKIRVSVKCKHNIFYKYFSLGLVLLKSRIS